MPRRQIGQRTVMQIGQPARRQLGDVQFRAQREQSLGRLIRQLDPAMVAKRRLDMFAYDALAGDRKAFATHWEALDWLEKVGIRVNPNRASVGNRLVE